MKDNLYNYMSIIMNNKFIHYINTIRQPLYPENSKTLYIFCFKVKFLLLSLNQSVKNPVALKRTAYFLLCEQSDYIFVSNI